jgi:hypothetical protein
MRCDAASPAAASAPTTVAAPFVVTVMYMHLIAMFDVLLVEDDVLGFASENGTQLPPTHTTDDYSFHPHDTINDMSHDSRGATQNKTTLHVYTTCTVANTTVL